MFKVALIDKEEILMFGGVSNQIELFSLNTLTTKDDNQLIQDL